MPASSKSQQRFFGLVRSMQKGEIKKTGKAGKVAKQMSKKDVKDFAKTKHTNLPNKVKKENNLNLQEKFKLITETLKKLL